MRGFMRALGLGGLFRRSHTAFDMSSSVLRPVSNPFLSALDSRLSTRSVRESSIDERPQFLFFCGSESIAERLSANASLRRDSICDVTPPVISHRMPVFFAAHCAFPMHSPTAAAGVRPSASIFN